jgi:hypothetical protein
VSQKNVLNGITKMTSNKRDEAIKMKEALAQDTLNVASQALGYLEDSLSECSTRDLVSIFNSAIKTHRELVSDIVAMSEVESKSEADLAKEYDSKVDELIRKISP